MSLPASRGETRTVELSGGDVVVHGLTMAQARACRDQKDENEADALCIAWGADMTVDDVREWLKTAGAADAKMLLDAIMELSGYGKVARFQS